MLAQAYKVGIALSSDRTPTRLGVPITWGGDMVAARTASPKDSPGRAARERHALDDGA